MKKRKKAGATRRPKRPGKGACRRPKPVVVSLAAEWIGRKLKITASHAERAVHVDVIDLDHARQRERFVKGICKQLPGADASAIEVELMRLYVTLPPPPEADPGAEGTSGPVPPPVRLAVLYTPAHKSNKGSLAAERDGITIHLDDGLNLRSERDRRRFIEAVKAKVPDLDVPDTESQLLNIADQMMVNAHMDAAPATNPVELDISRIVRPELFFVPEISGMAVPVVLDACGKPAAHWHLYLRWVDGRREFRDLNHSIDLPENRRLWVHPTPGAPAINTLPAWASASRRSWLAGSAAPNSAGLFKRLCERIAHYIDLPADVAAGTTATLALWTVLTYCWPAWDALPYIYVGGPMHSGKTRVFEILARLVFRPHQSSNLTAPALFRTLHDRGGTLLFDEAERLRQPTPEQKEILSMLLAGYKRGGQATRLEPVGDSFRTVAFDVYGPKALACIAGLPETLASRCITIMMFRAGPDSTKPQRRIDADPAAWQSLRDELHALTLDHGPTWLELAQRSNVCPKGINGRAYELWQPLLALASWIETEGASGLLTLVQQFAMQSIDAAKDDAVPESDELLLELLTEAVRCDQWPTPGELLSQAQERDPSTFGKPNGHGPRWQPNTVTRRLKSYGIPVPRKVNGQRRYREVTMEILRRIQRHYSINLGIPDPASSPEAPTLTGPTDPVGSADRRV